MEASRVRKSVGCETTFPYDLTSFDAMTDELYKLAAKLNGRLDRAGFRGNTLTLKIKFADFRLQTRSLSPGYELFASAEIFPLATALLRDAGIEGHPVRLLGLSVRKPDPPGAARTVPAVEPRPLTVMLQVVFQQVAHRNHFTFALLQHAQ